MNFRKLDSVTKDAMQILSQHEIFLKPGQSLFKRDWDIEREFVFENLSVTRHFAVLPIVQKFVEQFAKENNVKEEDVRSDLTDPHSAAYENYLSFLHNYLPRVTEFLDSFQVSNIKLSLSHTSFKLCFILGIEAKTILCSKSIIPKEP